MFECNLYSFRGTVIALQLSADEQLLYSGSLDKDCVMWDLSSGQVRFKKSCSSPITNILVAKIDTDDVNEGSSISIPFSVSFLNNSFYLHMIFFSCRILRMMQMEK